MALEAEASPTLIRSAYAQFTSPTAEPRSLDLKSFLGFSPLLFESIQIQPTLTLDYEGRPTS